MFKEFSNAFIFFKLLLTILSLVLFAKVRLFGVSCTQCLNLQEYQSKELMKNHGVKVQKFRVADGKNDVSELIKELSKSI